MKHYLLNHQPQKGLQAACAQQGQAPTCNARGKGRTSASPKTLTRILLVLLTMFLLPSAAWGQWEPYTFVFYGGLSSDNEGWSLYAVDGSTWQYVNTTSYTDHLSTAVVSGSNSGENKGITINVLTDEGTSVLTPPPSSYTIKKVTLNYSNLEVTEGSEIYVRAANSEKTSYYTDPCLMTSEGSLDIKLSDEGIPSENLCFLIYSNNNKAYSYNLNSITITKIADYNLSIGDVPLTGSNVNPETGAVTGMTGISFAPANTENETPATLTLNNANFGPSYKGIVWSGNGNLKIQYSGNNIINTRNGNELNVGDDAGYCIIGNSSSDLILSASDQASTLTLKPSYGGSTESNSSRAAISGFENVTLDSGWGMYYTDDYLAATATSLTAGKEVVICKGQPYGISVGGVPVTSANINDVLNDGGTVKFKLATLSPDGGQTPDTPATLTLDGAIISGNIESNITPLTVYLIGKNTINAGESVAPFQFTEENGHGVLVFETTKEEDGMITLNGDFTVSGSDANQTLTIGNYDAKYYVQNELREYFQDKNASTTIFRYWVIDDKSVFYNPHYGITVGSYEVTRLNKGSVTALGSGDITYSPEGNIISVPENSYLSYIVIKSHISELNVQISGNCSLKSIKFEENEEFETPATMTLNIDRDPDSTPGTNFLTLDNGSDAAISGFTSVNISENLHLDKPTSLEGSWDDYVGMVVISDEVFYDLWVEGTQVSSGNANDIFVDKDDHDGHATVSFDKTTNTLTLNEAQITPEAENCGIESKLDKLTVNIIGSNTITCYEENSAAIKGSGSNSIEFVSDVSEDEESGSIGITALNPISDIKATYKNGLGFTTVSGQTHYIEHLELPGISSTSSEDGISVTLSRPYSEVHTDLNTKYENATMYYSITYASETDNIGVTEYTESFTMAKPGTVTAYLIPGEGRGQSDNATGKYYGYPDAPYTMAVGDELTPEIYPAIEEDDYIELSEGTTSGDEDIASFTYSDGIVKATGIGSTTLTAIYSFGDQPFTVLNPIADPQASTEFAATFSVIVGGSLSDYFEGNNNFCTFYNTDQTTTYAVPEGMNAYVITGADPETGKVTTAGTTVLPPNTPVLLEKGSAKAFTYIPATSGTAPSVNILLYTGNTDVQATEGSNLYVLYNDKFVKVTTGTRILSQKCYLKLNTSSGTRGYYDIDGSDGTTGIREVKSEGVKGEKLADGAWHDLQGRRLSAKPTKPGLYILNGKKIVIK